MVNTFQEILRQFGRLFRWWIIVLPWDQAIRVRLGKHTRVLGPGIYLRIPYIDLVFQQSIRERSARNDMQTLTTRDDHTISLSSTMIFSICDIEKLFQSLHHPEDTLTAIVQASTATFVNEHDSEDVTPDSIEDYLNEQVCFDEMGLTGVKFYITNFAKVRTYRLLQDKSREWRTGTGIRTDRHEDSKPE